MWRASLALLLASSLALADDEPHAQPDAAPIAAATDTRSGLAQQLADESATLDRTIATVTEKLSAVDTDRAKRLAAAYRALRGSIVPGEQAMIAARRRAAVRMLVARDVTERELLADELAQLSGARSRLANEVARVPDIVLPAELERPAKGSVARRFGTFQHERSKAMLSRRGIDIEVETKAPVVATADGVVRYAGPIRGLDRGIVIDHGSFYTVIAKLGDIAAPIGVPVKRGDRVGRAARHRVYVEVRIKVGPSGLPVDPEPLFAGKR